MVVYGHFWGFRWPLLSGALLLLHSTTTVPVQHIIYYGENDVVRYSVYSKVQYQVFGPVGSLVGSFRSVF